MTKKTRNKIVTGACFGFCAIHCIIIQIVSMISGTDEDIIILGIIMAVNVPLSVADERPKMLEDSAVWTRIFMHTLFNIMVSYLWWCWWLLPLSAVETIILICFFLDYRGNKKGKREKRNRCW